jgi:hypothetical protein
MIAADGCHCFKIIPFVATNLKIICCIMKTKSLEEVSHVPHGYQLSKGPFWLLSIGTRGSVSPGIGRPESEADTSI